MKLLLVQRVVYLKSRWRRQQQQMDSTICQVGGLEEMKTGRRKESPYDSHLFCLEYVDDCYMDERYVKMHNKHLLKHLLPMLHGPCPSPGRAKLALDVQKLILPRRNGASAAYKNGLSMAWPSQGVPF